MSTSVTLNGVSYSVPAVGEASWGTSLSAYLVAISTGLLSKAGGSFTLTADADFGASFGLKSAYYKSRGTVSTAGVVRLANTESVAWRNAANNANLLLAASASDRLQFDGVNVPTISSTDTLTNKTLTTPSISTPRITSGTASTVPYLDASKDLVSSAVTPTELGYVSGVTSAIQTQIDAKASKSGATFTGPIFMDNNQAIRFYEANANGTGAVEVKVAADITAGTKVLTLPDATDTLVGRDTTDTLTNKTLTSPTVKGTLLLQNSAGAQPELALSEDPDNGTNKVTIKAPASLAADYTLTLPVDDGGANQVLQTDGSGGLSWATVASTVTTTQGDLIKRGASADERLAIGAANTVLTSNGTDPAWSTTLVGGTYTPTLANVANCDSITLGKATYTRIGNIVTVYIYGALDVTTGSTRTAFTCTLPVIVSTNFTNDYQASGTFIQGMDSASVGTAPGGVYATVGAKTVTFDMSLPIATSARDFGGSFQYEYY